MARHERTTVQNMWVTTITATLCRKTMHAESDAQSYALISCNFSGWVTTITATMYRKTMHAESDAQSYASENIMGI